MAAYNNNDFENQEFMKINEPTIVVKKSKKIKNKKKQQFDEQFGELLFSEKKVKNSNLKDYTEFDNDTMDYGVVKGKFTHSNMVPFSKRKDDSYFDKGTRTLQMYTGRDKYWKHKRETENFFNPQKDFKNVHGFETYTQKIKNRFIPSIYTDARLPNTNMKVGPGLRKLDIIKNFNKQPSDDVEENFTEHEEKLAAIKNNQDGLYTNFRIMPKTIDELRPLGQEKISYRGVVNHGKSEVDEGTSRDFNVTKWKLKSFKETTNDDYMPKLANVPKQAMYGSIKRSTNARHHPDVKTPTTYGPLMKPKGIIIGTEDFTHTQTSKSSFNNDKHLVTDPQNKKGQLQTFSRPQTTLKETVLHESYGNVENENTTYLNNFEQPQTTLRETVLHESYGNVQNENSTYVNTKEAPGTTLKETILHEKYGNVQNENSTYINTKETPGTTLKETILHEKYGPTEQNFTTYVNAKEAPGTTLKETILHESYGPTEQNFTTYINAKETPGTTLKETILHENYGPTEQKFNTYVNAKETPGTTLKETILHENYGPIEQRFNTYVNAKETPGTTLKETILHENYGPVKQELTTYVNAKETPGTTLKETLLYENYGPTKQKFTSYVNAKETPGTTLKETVLYENYGPTKQQFTSYVNAKETPGTTMKETVLHESYGNVGNINTNYINTKETPGTTMRETVLHESYGNVGNVNTNYVNTKEAPGTTMRETVLHESYGNVTDANRNVMLNNYEAPQTTLKETVLHESYGNVTDKNRNMQLNNYVPPQTTLKETVLHESYGNVTDANRNMQLNNYVAPQTTLKETLLHESYGNIGNENSIYINNYEPPDITTKESTLISYQGNAKSATNKPSSRMSAKNMRLANKKHNKPTYRKPEKIKRNVYSGTMVHGRVRGPAKERNYQYHNITIDSNPGTLKSTHTRRRKFTKNINGRTFLNVSNITKNPYINNLVHQSESAVTESIKLR